MDGAQHAQRQAVDFQQAQGIEVVLVPLDDSALRHGGVLDRHQPVQCFAGYNKTANVL